MVIILFTISNIGLLIFHHLVWYQFFHSVLVIVNTSVPMSLKAGEVCKPSTPESQVDGLMHGTEVAGGTTTLATGRQLL